VFLYDDETACQNANVTSFEDHDFQTACDLSVVGMARLTVVPEAGGLWAR